MVLQEEMDYEFGRESGFINSQPSLAECLTSLTNPAGDAFQSSSIKSSPRSLPTLQTVSGLDTSVPPRQDRSTPALRGCSPLQTASILAEYPWMKEKKSTKRGRAAAAPASPVDAAPTTDSPPHYFPPQGKTWLITSMQRAAGCWRIALHKEPHLCYEGVPTGCCRMFDLSLLNLIK